MRKIGGCLALVFVVVVYISIVMVLYQLIQPGNAIVFALCTIVATYVVYVCIKRWQKHVKLVAQVRARERAERAGERANEKSLRELLQPSAEKLARDAEWAASQTVLCMACRLTFQKPITREQCTPYGEYSPLRCPGCGSSNVLERQTFSNGKLKRNF